MNAVADVHVGDIVYLRALCTRKAAVGEVRYFVPNRDTCMVQLGTDWYDWDSANVFQGRRAGDIMTLKLYMIEAIRE